MLNNETFNKSFKLLSSFNMLISERRWSLCRIFLPALMCTY